MEEKPMVARIRPVAAGDYIGIEALNRRHGLETPARSAWLARHEQNPLRKYDAGLFGWGWVAETDNREIVGHIASFPLAYELGGESYVAVAAGDWVTDVGYRSMSLPLLRAFLAQPGADIALNATASHVASRVFEAYRFRRVPVPGYDEVLYWITDYVGTVKAALRRRFPGRGGAKFAAPIIAAALAVADRISHDRAATSDDRILVSNAFGPDFDQFWNEIRGATVLQRVRDAEWMTWHFAAGILDGSIHVVQCMRAAKMIGYGIFQRQDQPEFELRRLRLVDLRVKDEGAAIIPLIMHAGKSLAHEYGVHIVESIGFSGATREAMESLAPRRRMLPSWPFLYKPMSPRAEEATRHAEIWDPCMLDGDASF